MNDADSISTDPTPTDPPRDDPAVAEPALDEPTLERIVNRVRRHPEFLTAVFDRYARAGGPAAGDLAGHLGLSRLGQLRLSLCRRPRAGSFEPDVRRLADEVGADPYRLAAVVRFADAAEAMAGHSSGVDLATDAAPAAAGAGDEAHLRPGVLAAARARRRGADRRPARGDDRGDADGGGAP